MDRSNNTTKALVYHKNDIHIKEQLMKKNKASKLILILKLKF